jgi:hypothetical protein
MLNRMISGPEGKNRAADDPNLGLLPKRIHNPASIVGKISSNLENLFAACLRLR